VLSFATRRTQRVNQLASVQQKKMNLLPFTRSTYSRLAKDSLLVAVIADSHTHHVLHPMRLNIAH